MAIIMGSKDHIDFMMPSKIQTVHLFGHVCPWKSAFVGFAKMKKVFCCHQLWNKEIVSHFYINILTVAFLALFRDLHTKHSKQVYERSGVTRASFAYVSYFTAFEKFSKKLYPNGSEKFSEVISKFSPELSHYMCSLLFDPDVCPPSLPPPIKT